MTTVFPGDLFADAQRLIVSLRDRALKLATAESCTGGLIAGLLTEVPGASDVLERGFVTYSNAAKIGDLNVDYATLQAHGAVSAEVAREMAEGAVRGSGASLAVSVTGIAGPAADRTKSLWASSTSVRSAKVRRPLPMNTASAISRAPISALPPSRPHSLILKAPFSGEQIGKSHHAVIEL